MAVGSELFFGSVEMTGEPAAFAGGVVEEEFGIAAVEDPDEAGGDFVGAAEGDEGGGEVFLVGGCRRGGRRGAFVGAFVVGLELDALAEAFVEGFDLRPGGFFAFGQLFREGFEFGVGGFDQGAGAEVLARFLGGVFGDGEERRCRWEGAARCG